MVKPISPDEVVAAKAKQMPGQVIEVFNELIAKHWDGRRSLIYQEYAAEIICERMDIKANVLYENNYMDIEDIYRDMGWKVRYDKPAYNESYDAYYEFTKP